METGVGGASGKFMLTALSHVMCRKEGRMWLYMNGVSFRRCRWTHSEAKLTLRGWLLGRRVVLWVRVRSGMSWRLKCLVF